MGLWSTLSRQLSNPTGWAGKLVARGMNRGNAALNKRAFECLTLTPGVSVLEVGFGGGATIPKLLETAGGVAGLDRAGEMVEAARKRYADEIESGRLRIDAGDVGSLPYADGEFDRILTVNTVYFWPDLAPVFEELRRVLALNGLLVVGIRDPAVMQKVSREIFTVRPPAEVAEALRSAGFSDVKLDSPADAKVHLLTAWR